MSQDLVQLIGGGDQGEGSLVQASKYGSEVAHQAISGSNFLPRLQLLGASTNLCKKGKAPIGSYAVLRGKDTVVHLLGESVDALVVSWRPKAIRFGAGNVQSFYNPASPGFKQVEVDSTAKDSGCMFGPEYLIYIPSVNEFCTFHFNNPTMRVAAAGMLPNVGKAVTCRVEFIEKGKNSWHGPVILNCSTPLPLPADVESFKAALIMQRDRFNNPKEDEEVEEVSVEQASAAGADRAR